MNRISVGTSYMLLDTCRRTGRRSRASRPTCDLADSAREAARDAVVGVVYRGAEVLETHDARQRDERDEKRVLDQVLALVFANEPSDEILHDSDPLLDRSYRIPAGDHLTSGIARPARILLVSRPRERR